MDDAARRGWIERLELFAFGHVEHRGAEDAAADAMAAAVPLIGCLVVSVTLYMLGAVALVQGGGLAAITLGVLEMAVARSVTVTPRTQAPQLIAFLFGLVTCAVGIAVLIL